jgi:hypothetical protein
MLEMRMRESGASQTSEWLLRALFVYQYNSMECFFFRHQNMMCIDLFGHVGSEQTHQHHIHHSYNVLWAIKSYM